MPSGALAAMLSANPEALCLTDPDSDKLSGPILFGRYNCIGIGPGIGQDPVTAQWLKTTLLSSDKPLVLDADALNILAGMETGMDLIPPGTVLTPHIREFERLFGPSETDLDRLHMLREKAAKYECIIVLKGTYTSTAWPDGTVFFNSTGNNGMAKGGSGDVLTGLICGLIAQEIEVGKAAVLGVYLHGSAGDLAAEIKGKNAMIAGDIIEQFGMAFKKLQGK
jgi:NAD(P)H-hydrate epimerase